MNTLFIVHVIPFQLASFYSEPHHVFCTAELVFRSV